MSVNPRVVLWLGAVGLTAADIARQGDADAPSVTVAGHRNLWTIHYSEWIASRGREWASSLGFRDSALGPAYSLAMRAGHTPAEFDAWLEGQAALAAGVVQLGAVLINTDRYAYHDEAGYWYIATAKAVGDLGARLLSGQPDAYSRWYAETDSVRADWLDEPVESDEESAP